VLGKFGKATALLLIWLLLPLSPAAAHSTLISSTPPANSSLTQLPLYVEVTFDEKLLVLGSAKSNVLQVLDSSGREVDAGNSKVSGAILRVGITKRNLTGVFTVSWRVVSGDGHPAVDSYQFSVGAHSQKPPLARTAANKADGGVWKKYRQEGFLVILALVFAGIWGGFARKRRSFRRR
jgi:methionine-rich copper-binding protein CopC